MNQRPGGVRVLLDHVIVMLDAKAYADVLASGEALGKELGRYAVKDSESSLAGRYSAAAVMGTSTLVEFFDVGAPPLPGITGGLVLSFETPGSIQTARSRLTDAGITFGYELVRRKADGDAEMQPWYHLIRPHLCEDNPFLLMVTEVTPEYFASIAATPTERGELTRRRYLDARIGHGREPGQALRDISSVRVRLRPDRARLVQTTLAALGFTPVAEQDCALGGADSTVIIVSDAQAPEGVTAVGLELDHVPAMGSVPPRFGATSTLDLPLRDGRGEWRFEPASPAPAGTVLSTADNHGR